MPRSFAAADLVIFCFYPFGMGMPGKTYSASPYRYGFNGKEKDNELKGDGNSLNYGDREYDPRLGRWFSTDQLRQVYSALSPYSFGANDPVNIIDSDGNILKDKDGNIIATSNGKPNRQVIRVVDNVAYVYEYQPVTIYTDKGNPVQAEIVTAFVKYTKVEGGSPSKSVETSVELTTNLGTSKATTESVKSNCHGYAFADSKLVIGDDRKNILNDEYTNIGVVTDAKPNSKLESEADLVVIYGGKFTTQANFDESWWYHTGKKQEDGKWTDKDSWTQVRNDLKSTAEVRDSHLEMAPLDDDRERVLYNRNNPADKVVESLNTIPKPANGIRIVSQEELKKVQTELKTKG